MSVVVSFRCSEQLEEFIEQKAEEQYLSKSAAAQQLLAEHIRDCMDTSEGDGGEGTGEDTRKLPETTTRLGSEVYEFQFPRKPAADAVRTEFSEHLHDNDDARTTEVLFAEDTPEEVLKQVNTRVSG